MTRRRGRSHNGGWGGRNGLIGSRCCRLGWERGDRWQCSCGARRRGCGRGRKELVGDGFPKQRGCAAGDQRHQREREPLPTIAHV